MIRREELDKILKLLNAGIIGPELNSSMDLGSPIKRIYGEEIFEFNYKYQNPEDVNDIDIMAGIPPKNISNSIDEDLTFINTELDKINNFQTLKISKNDYRYKWKIKFFGLELNIEDTILDFATIDNTDIGYINNIESINQYLISEFSKLNQFIINPDIFKTLESNTINFNEFQTLNYYYSSYKDDYNSMVIGNCLFSFKYMIDIYAEKI